MYKVTTEVRHIGNFDSETTARLSAQYVLDHYEHATVKIENCYYGIGDDGKPEWKEELIFMEEK